MWLMTAGLGSGGIFLIVNVSYIRVTSKNSMADREFDDPELQERLEIFPPEYQEIILDGDPEEIAQRFGRAFGLSEHDRVVLANAHRFYLLVMLDEEGWIDFVHTYTDVDHELATLLVHETLKRIPDDIKEFINDLRTST